LEELPHFAAKIEYSHKRNTRCHRKKLPFTERNFLSQEETYCHRKNLQSREENSCDRKKLPLTGRGLLSQ
jgi:hypothetical protein